MRPKTYRVELTEAERIQLLLLVRQGKTPARALQRAHILNRNHPVRVRRYAAACTSTL